MSAPDTKTQSERLFSKNSNSNAVAIKGQIIRRPTDGNLFRPVSASHGSLTTSPTDTNLQNRQNPSRRRTDRSNTVASGDSSADAKACELRARVQRLVDRSRPSVEQLKRLAEAFQSLLNDKVGLELFREFLLTEFCQENIDFWCACEDYRHSGAENQLILKQRAKQLFDEYVSEESSRQVNLDFETREHTAEFAAKGDSSAFELAQRRIQSLMERDKYQRFLQSEVYRHALELAGKLADSAHASDSN